MAIDCGGSGFVWWCVRETKSGIEQAERMRKEKERRIRVK